MKRHISVVVVPSTFCNLRCSYCYELPLLQDRSRIAEESLVPMFEHLGEVTCPVTVARGVDDGPGPAALVPLIAGGLANATVEEHPELGHFGPLEDPASVAASIAAAILAAERS